MCFNMHCSLRNAFWLCLGRAIHNKMLEDVASSAVARIGNIVLC